jgi:CheY-like chemotaxis protein
MNQGPIYHGIVIDNSMPVMNGTVATRTIRELGYTGKIFGVTGNGFQSDIDDFLAQGADEVLVKPVGMDGYGTLMCYSSFITMSNYHRGRSVV